MSSDPLQLNDHGGKGTPVLLLHGIGASSHIFQDVAQGSRSGFRMLTADLSGRGDRSFRTSLEPRALARLLLQACEARDLEPLLVVGHSFGGLVALELVRAAPARVRGAVLASVPALGLPRARALLGLRPMEALLKRAEHLPKSQFLARFYLGQIWGSAAPLLPRHVAGYVEAMRHPAYFSSTLTSLRAVATYELDAPAVLATGVPLRLLWGGEDRLVSSKEGAHLEKVLKAPLKVLSGVGHCLPEEAPEAVLQALQSLLALRQQ